MKTKRTCVNCGCTDTMPCAVGCCWIVEHQGTPTGVCSSCDQIVLAELQRCITESNTPLPIKLTAKGRAAIKR